MDSAGVAECAAKPDADYVTRSEFDALAHDVKVLVGKMESASEPKGADHHGE